MATTTLAAAIMRKIEGLNSESSRMIISETYSSYTKLKDGSERFSFSDSSYIDIYTRPPED